MKKIRNIFRGNEGFTLIELLIVIVIIGVLAAIAVPNIAGLGDSADEQAVKANMRTLMIELEAFMATNSDATIDSINDSDLTFSFSDADESFSSSAIKSLIEQDVTFVSEVTNSGNGYDITAKPSSGDWFVRINDGAITTSGDKTSKA